MLVLWRRLAQGLTLPSAVAWRPCESRSACSHMAVLAARRVVALPSTPAWRCPGHVVHCHSLSPQPGTNGILLLPPLCCCSAAVLHAAVVLLSGAGTDSSNHSLAISQWVL